ncbi:MAG: Dipeptide and tripeptide permease B [Chlamydiia bacterium]|nr:Dipeptide and tripeptide permease B [Chlamydiia bacterium]MCH9615270.1 Dipeptide and tripeptide permease B [Chlamydiia bacterium]MCH9628408.1 Dipeptide and tripeptide permease B [Chlamydiia bacterium]
MVGFGSIIASLVLYQINILKIPSHEAYAIFAAAVALLWILPLGGGYVSTQLGYTNAARVGILFCALGFIVLCVPSTQALYTGMGFFVVGNAFATPATWCMVDHCYPKESPLREAGFTLFYLFFNLGGIFGIFAGGAIASYFGFSYEFGLNALCMLGALALLHFAKHKIHVHKGRSIAPQVNWSKQKIWGSLFGLSIVATPITAVLFKNPEVNNILMLILLAVMIVLLGSTAYKQKTHRARNKMLAFLVLSLISVAFWILYSLEPSFVSVFISNNVDKTFLGIQIPASSYFAFDGVFVILIGLLLSRVWYVLSQKNINPSIAIKFAASLVVIGLGFGFLALMTKIMGTRIMPSVYIVIAYAIFAFAELLVSPLGISMVGSLAPEGQEGIMMGFWQLCCGIGGVFAGYIAIFAPLPAGGEALSISNPLYTKVFLAVGIGGVIAGLIVLPFINKLKYLMAEPPYDEPHL